MSANATLRWQQIVWICAALALLVVISVLVWFVGATVIHLVAILERHVDNGPLFVLSGISIVTLTLIRILAILLGGAISFAGLVISFFAHKQESTMESSVTRGERGAKLALATYSPGIVAMIIGAGIIVFALFAKTTYSSKGPSTPIVRNGNIPNGPVNVPRPVEELPELDDSPKPVN